MLLHIVPLAGDIRRDHPPRAQPHPARLALPRIRLLGLRDADLQTHAFHLGSVDEGRGGLLAERLRLAAFAHHLHECRGALRCAGECALVVGCEWYLGCCAAEEWLCGFDGRTQHAD